MALQSFSLISFTSQPSPYVNPVYVKSDIEELKRAGAEDLVQMNVLIKSGRLEGKIVIAAIGIDSDGRLLISNEDKFSEPCPPYCKFDKASTDTLTYSEALSFIQGL